MSDDTRAPRPPFDDGPQPQGDEHTRLGQEQLEAALARSRGIGEGGEVQSGDALHGADVAYDGGAEAPTDPSLREAPEVLDPNATVGLDREELAAVLASGHASDARPTPADGHVTPGDGPGATGSAEVEHADVEHADVEHVEHADVEHAAGEGADTSGSSETPQADLPDRADQPDPAHRGAEPDDLDAYPLTEPTPAQDLAANAIGAETVTAITVDAAGAATAPDVDLHDPDGTPTRRTLEIDRTAARVAAAGPALGAAGSALGTSLPAGPAEAPAEQEPEIVQEDEVSAPEGTAVPPSEPTDGDSSPSPMTASTQTPSEGVATGTPGSAELGRTATEDHAHDAAAAGASVVTVPSTSASTSTSGADADDATFAPLRLSANTDDDDLAPVKPRKRGNRTFAVFVALVASVVFAAVYLLAFALLRTAFAPGVDPVGAASEFGITTAFTVPVIAFAAFAVLWALLANRAGWWSYILGGFIAALVAVAAYYLGATLPPHLSRGEPIWTLDFSEVLNQLRASEHLLTALVAAIAARESFTWVGGIAAARGRRVALRNRRDRAAYDARMAERHSESAEARGEAA